MAVPMKRETMTLKRKRFVHFRSEVGKINVELHLIICSLAGMMVRDKRKSPMTLPIYTPLKA